MPVRTLIDRLLAEYARTGHLPAISGGDGEDEQKPEDDQQKPKPDAKPAGLTPEIQEWVSGLIARETKAAKEKAVKAEQDRIAAEKDREAKERERKADEEKGEFAKVKQSIEAERDGFKTEAERIKGEYEAVAGLFDKQYKTAIKDIPDDLKLFQPADDASILDRVAFLDKLQTALKKRGSGTTPGNGPNPKPGGNGATANEKDVVARTRARARF